MLYLLSFFLTIILGYTGMCTAYLLLFAIAGCLRRTALSHNPFTSQILPHRIAVLIPAYREDAVIVDVARQALLQSYNKNYYDIIVIADSLQPETLQQLQTYPVQLIRVNFEESTKAKALNAALQELPAYDIALVLDADNVMEPDFLQKIHSAFARGCQVVQAHRIAKNTNTAVAVLDAISEEINNHIFRKGHRNAGLSAALIGSGMAFHYPLFKRLMAGIHTTGGFDKELELRLLQQKYTIHYLEDALVYDEKVQQPKAFRQQRTRWMAAQLKYLSSYFLSGIRALVIERNVDFFDKVFQLLLLPRILLLGLLIVLSLATALLATPMFFTIGIVQVLALGLALMLATPTYLLHKLSWKELATLPVLFVQFILSFTGIKQAQKKFIHTQHGEMKQVNN